MHHPLDSCLCCVSNELRPFADLGDQPLANDFHPPTVACEKFPLAVNVCKNCFHSQLTVSVEPERLFQYYPYVSGTTQTLDKYFTWFAAMVTERCGQPGRVLDIGCNDGSQLMHFSILGWNTSGVDPAENIDLRPDCDAALYRGFWSAEASRQLPGPYQAIVAQNVFAHVRDPDRFLAHCHEVLATNGRLFIQTSQADMIERQQFDTIYHEHISFFSMRSMQALAERCGFKLVDVAITPIHGESYVFQLEVENGQEPEPSCTVRLHQEAMSGRYELDSYCRFSSDMKNRAAAIRDVIETHKKMGFRIVGYGAAAKANTFLNYSDLDLELILDDNPRKHGLLTPGSDILVKPVAALANDSRPTFFVILAWNFYEEICDRLRQLRRHSADRVARYFPTLDVQPLSRRSMSRLDRV